MFNHAFPVSDIALILINLIVCATICYGFYSFGVMSTTMTSSICDAIKNGAQAAKAMTDAICASVNAWAQTVEDVFGTTQSKGKTP